MRARTFRPSFDALDARVVLSDTTGTLAGGDAAAAVVAPPSQDPMGNIDWYLPGNPPANPTGSGGTPILWDVMPTT